MELLIFTIEFVSFSATETFKFQYGATNIPFQNGVYDFSAIFKFQYGATNMLPNEYLKCVPRRFKFQYGATNI